MNIEIYEDTYNIAVDQCLNRKTAGSKRRKEAFRSKKRRSRVLRDKYGFIADGKMLSKLSKSYYDGHAQCEEWRNRCVAKRKSNSCSYKTVSERRRIITSIRRSVAIRPTRPASAGEHLVSLTTTHTAFLTSSFLAIMKKKMVWS